MLQLPMPRPLRALFSAFAKESVLLRACAESIGRGDADLTGQIVTAASQRHFLGRSLSSGEGLTTARIGPDISGSIGHTAIALGTRSKLAGLGLGPTYSYQLMGRTVANTALLSYFVSRDTNVWAGRESSSRSTKSQSGNDGPVRVLWTPTYFGLQGTYQALSLSERLWEDEGREPLLRLRNSHRSTAMQFLAKFGMSEEEWFVALHVRDSPTGVKNSRDADIYDYREMIAAVNDLGGWVVRLGAKWSRPAMGEKLIDLRGEISRPPEVDVFALAEARLAVVTSSGPNCVPPLFGTPMLWSNATPLDAFTPYFARTRILPKTLRRPERKLPPITQMLDAGVARNGARSLRRSRHEGMKWTDNESGLIRDATLLMLDGELKNALTPSQVRIQEEMFRIGNVGRPVVSSLVSEELVEGL